MNPILVLGAFLVALAATASPVAAQLVDIQCEGTQTSSYSPGLLLTPQTVTVTFSTIYAPCTSVSDPEITTGLASGTASVTTSCLELLDGPPGSTTRVITWNTGETSTWVFTLTSQHLGGVVFITQTGAIVAGKFAGSTAVGVVALLSPPVIQCLASPGVTRVQGALTLTIAL